MECKCEWKGAAVAAREAIEVWRLVAETRGITISRLQTEIDEMQEELDRAQARVRYLEQKEKGRANAS